MTLLNSELPQLRRSKSDNRLDAYSWMPTLGCLLLDVYMKHPNRLGAEPLPDDSTDDGFDVKTEDGFDGPVSETDDGLDGKTDDGFDGPCSFNDCTDTCLWPLSATTAQSQDMPLPAQNPISTMHEAFHVVYVPVTEQPPIFLPAPRQQGYQFPSPMSPAPHVPAPEAVLKALMDQAGTGRTTANLCNIPNNKTREELLEELDANGCEEKYNFVYYPLDFRKCKNGSGKGIAFVNFISEKDMTDFKILVDNLKFKWKDTASRKVAEVKEAAIQGLKANVERYRNHSVMHPDVPEKFKPLIFVHGQCIPPMFSHLRGERISFPPPDKPMKKPREFGEN